MQSEVIDLTLDTDTYESEEDCYVSDITLNVNPDGCSEPVSDQSTGVNEKDFSLSDSDATVEVIRVISYIDDNFPDVADWDVSSNSRTAKPGLVGIDPDRLSKHEEIHERHVAETEYCHNYGLENKKKHNPSQKKTKTKLCTQDRNSDTTKVQNVMTDGKKTVKKCNPDSFAHVANSTPEEKSRTKSPFRNIIQSKTQGHRDKVSETQEHSGRKKKRKNCHGHSDSAQQTLSFNTRSRKLCVSKQRRQRQEQEHSGSVQQTSLKTWSKNLCISKDRRQEQEHSVSIQQTSLKMQSQNLCISENRRQRQEQEHSGSVQQTSLKMQSQNLCISENRRQRQEQEHSGSVQQTSLKTRSKNLCISKDRRQRQEQEQEHSGSVQQTSLKTRSKNLCISKDRRQRQEQEHSGFVQQTSLKTRSKNLCISKDSRQRQEQEHSGSVQQTSLKTRSKNLCISKDRRQEQEHSGSVQQTSLKTQSKNLCISKDSRQRQEQEQEHSGSVQQTSLKTQSKNLCISKDRRQEQEHSGSVQQTSLKTQSQNLCISKDSRQRQEQEHSGSVQQTSLKMQSKNLCISKDSRQRQEQEHSGSVQQTSLKTQSKNLCISKDGTRSQEHCSKERKRRCHYTSEAEDGMLKSSCTQIKRCFRKEKRKHPSRLQRHKPNSLQRKPNYLEICSKRRSKRESGSERMCELNSAPVSFLKTRLRQKDKSDKEILRKTRSSHFSKSTNLDDSLGMFYVCGSNCGYTTLFGPDYQSHVEECGRRGSLVCNHCFHQAVDSVELLHHIQEHCDQSDTLFLCSCGFGTNNQSCFYDHLVYWCKNAGYFCMKCDTMFGELSDLKQHIKENVLHVVWCSVCSAICCELSVMLKHLGEHSKAAYWTMEELLCFERKQNRDNGIENHSQRCLSNSRNTEVSRKRKGVGSVDVLFSKKQRHPSNIPDIFKGCQTTSSIKMNTSEYATKTSSHGQKKSSCHDNGQLFSVNKKTSARQKSKSRITRDRSFPSETPSVGPEPYSVGKETLSVGLVPYSVGKETSSAGSEPYSVFREMPLVGPEPYSVGKETPSVGPDPYSFVEEMPLVVPEPYSDGKETLSAGSKRPPLVGQKKMSIDQKTSSLCNPKKSSSDGQKTSTAVCKEMSSEVCQETSSADTELPFADDRKTLISVSQEDSLSNTYKIFSSIKSKTSVIGGEETPSLVEQKSSFAEEIFSIRLNTVSHCQEQPYSDIQETLSFQGTASCVASEAEHKHFQRAADDAVCSDEDPELFLEPSVESDREGHPLEHEDIEVEIASDIREYTERSLVLEFMKSSSELSRQQITGTSNNTEACIVQKVFKQKQLKTIRCVVIPSGDFYTKAVKCYGCTFSSMRKSNLERHLKSCHPGVEVIIEPSQSSAELILDTEERAVVENRGEFLDKEIVWLYENHGLFYVCSICKKVISKKFVLHCHLLDHLEISLGTCSVCDSDWCCTVDHHDCVNWKSPSDVVKDIQIRVASILGDVRQNGELVTFLKPLMGTTHFNRKLSHLIDRTGSRPCCRVCSVTYFSDYSMHGHILVKHLNVSLFTCEVCGFGGINRFDVARHMKMKHPDHPLKLLYNPIDRTSMPLFDVPRIRLPKGGKKTA